MCTNYRLETIKIYKCALHQEDIHENNHMNMEKNPQRVYYHVPWGGNSFRHWIHISLGAARWGMHKSGSNMDMFSDMALGNLDTFIKRISSPRYVIIDPLRVLFHIHINHMIVFMDVFLVQCAFVYIYRFQAVVCAHFSFIW